MYELNCGEPKRYATFVVVGFFEVLNCDYLTNYIFS